MTNAFNQPPILVSILLALLSGILTVFSFPNFGFSFLTWFSLIPLLYALSTVQKTIFAFLLGELFGIVYFYGTCYWITYSMINYGELPVLIAHLLALILVAIVSLFPAIFSASFNYIVRKLGIEALIFAPIIWSAVEYLRLHVSGVGWNALGYSQSFSPSIIWPSRFGGVFLISTLVVLSSAAITLLICKRTRLTILVSSISLLVCLAVPIIGKIYIKEVALEKDSKSLINVVAAQALAPVNVPQEELSESLSRQIDLSLQGITKLRDLKNSESQTILVAWPEAPFNFAYDSDSDWKNIFREFTQKHKVYLLFNGEAETENAKGQYNSVMLISPEGDRVGQYNKIHLLPFGEYVPMRGYLPLIDRIPALAGDYTPANNYSTVEIEGIKIGVFICFESVFPDITRETARSGATAFINVANDGWFGKTPISRQHLAHVVMRAVETNRPLLRVTNVGISAYIDQNGQIKDETPVFETALRLWQIEKVKEKLPLTFYTRFGDVFAFACILITLLLILPASKIFVRRKA
ncbi:MAG: apolipoprotein N-acyltransferase [Acidobacteria bacterium]|nr:apolipoprotein N-acyltransferase [Acidobacteriota bacterium]